MIQDEAREEHRQDLKHYFANHFNAHVNCIGNLCLVINSWMRVQGFWESSNKGEKIALIHSELSEALEAVRKGDEGNEAEEMADTVIRIFDYCGQHNINLGEAICVKMQRNLDRSRKHGKAF